MIIEAVGHLCHTMTPLDFLSGMQRSQLFSPGVQNDRQPTLWAVKEESLRMEAANVVGRHLPDEVRIEAVEVPRLDRLPVIRLWLREGCAGGRGS